jgi:hypothetical protein
MAKYVTVLIASAMTLNACSCDDSPKQVNDLVAALTPLPRLPSDLADELRHLKVIIDAHAQSDKPHIQLARDTFVASYLDGMLIAQAAGRSATKLTDLFADSKEADFPGSKTMLDWLSAAHELKPFLEAVARPPGVPRADALNALARAETGEAGVRARLLLTLHFRRLLDAAQHDIGSIVANYPYPCAATLNALLRGDQLPDAQRAACPITCKAFKDKPKAKAKKRRKNLISSCPPKALGLRAPEEMRYAGPQLAPLRFALIHGESILRRARKDGGALGDATRRALSDLQGALKNRPFPAPFPGWFGAGEFRTGVIMDFGAALAGGKHPQAQRFVSINRSGGMRTGIRPALAVDDQGIRFMDLESELAWPGRAVQTRPDPLFPAPSGDPLADALAGLNMRAESLFEGSKDKPLMIVLSRGAPPRYVGRVLSELPRGTIVELAYWDHGVRAVRAQVGWTRVKTEVQNARDLELADATEESPDEQLDPAAEERLKIRIRLPKSDAGTTEPPGDTGKPVAKTADAGAVIEPTEDAGEALRLGAMGAVKLARQGERSRVTISGKELLFNDLAGDARLPLRGYASNKKSKTMGAWRSRLLKMANLLPKDAKVMLYVRGDAPMDAVLELIGALAPRAVNLSFPHRRIEVIEDDLYAPPALDSP